MNKPNFFIVGQPKSGTTALHYSLAEHPEIYMADIKEPFFFCKDIHEESDQYHDLKLYFHYRDEKSYLRLFVNAKPNQLIGESSPIYLYSKVAAHEIYKFNSTAKIIMVLREPVEFLYSFHNEMINQTYETEKDFSKALALEEMRKQGNCVPKTVAFPSTLFYFQRAKYSEQISRFYDCFDKKQIKLIIYEDFRQNNQQVYQDIFDFLEVNDKSFVVSAKTKNSRSKPRSETLNKIIRNPLLRKISNKLLPAQSYEFIHRNVVNKLLWKNEKVSPIDPQLKHELMKTFKPEVLKTSELIGVDLEKRWGYDKI